MRATYINSTVIWNGFWSHAQQLATALAHDAPVLFFESLHLTESSQSVLFARGNHAVPQGVTILSSQKTFPRVSAAYLLANQWHSLATIFRNRNEFATYLSYNFVDVAGLLLAKLLGKKTVFMLVDEYDTLTRWPHLTPLFRVLLALQMTWSDTVVCTAKKLSERAKQYNHDVHYVPNAVDGTLVRDANMETKNGTTVGFVGSLGNWVDWELFVELAQEFPECTFEVIGDGAMLAPLRVATEKAKLTNLKLRGHVSRDRIGGYLATFDVALIPFLRNAITDSVSPIKLFEYWLFALPVVARETYELAGFKDTLLLYETHEQAIAQLRHCLDHRAESQALGEAGKKLVESTYNWDRYRAVFRDEILKNA